MSVIPVNSPITAAPKPLDSPLAPDSQRAKLRKAAQDFEAVFISNLLKQAHKTMSESSPLFGNSSEAKFYREMMDEQVAERISRTGAFGLADVLIKNLEKALPPEK